MRVLVTGASGFLGRFVVPALSAAGHDAVAALRVDFGDIGPSTDWTKSLQDIDAVIHLAARVHVMRDHGGGAAEFDRVNTAGTLQLARAAARAGAKRLVFVSTIKVNGEQSTTQPFRADDAPDPLDPYARSKLAAERGLLEIDGLDPVIVRPPLVHGPGAKGNLARLCRLAELGLPMPFASIANRRNLVGVENLANLLVHCLTHPAATREVFLASDGEALSTPDLYRTIAESLGRPARMFKVPVPLLRALAAPLGFGGEVDRLTQSLEIDASKARERLGWTPLYSARTGIAAMAHAYAGGRAR